ncbi:MAG: hypothetical protein ABI353_10640 [Isosphaeraceae bacterium]
MTSQAGKPALDDQERAFAWFRNVLALATLLMLVLSWPLWVETTAFPRVSFVPGGPGLGRSGSWAAYGLVLMALAGVATGRHWLAVSLVLLLTLVLLDQHRFQPWVYQFLLIGLALATVPKGQALGLARLFVVVLYVHSSLSKLDVSFTNELGRAFLETAVHPLGLNPETWPVGVRRGLILAMPAWELAVAAGLCVKRTRRLAMIGAVALHLALLGILGPWGLRHSTIVLVWNGAMIVEVLLLFRPSAFLPIEATGPRFRAAGLTRWVFVMAAILPLGERWGWFDPWPAFALYASHVERTDVLLHEDDLLRYPLDVQQYATYRVAGGWRRLDLTAWSRAVRGVPVYPGGRAQIGLAEALADQVRGTVGPRVVLWGRAERWTGKRSRVEALGRDQVRHLGGRFRLNAHPSRPSA